MTQHQQHSTFAAVSVSRTLEHARDAMLSKSASVGPHVRVPFLSDQVAAFREGDRVRFEVVHADGSFTSDLTFGAATRLLARAVDESFA